MNECCFRKWTPVIEMKGAQQFVRDAKKKTKKNMQIFMQLYTRQTQMSRLDLKLFFLYSCDLMSGFALRQQSTDLTRQRRVHY